MANQSSMIGTLTLINHMHISDDDLKTLIKYLKELEALEYATCLESPFDSVEDLCKNIRSSGKLDIHGTGRWSYSYNINNMFEWIEPYDVEAYTHFMTDIIASAGILFKIDYTDREPNRMHHTIKGSYIVQPRIDDEGAYSGVITHVIRNKEVL